MKYSVNIETVYRELPFEARFAAAKRDGFDYVEIWDWTVKDPDELAVLCREYGVEISCMGGDGPFSLCDPAHGEEYLDFLRNSLQMAQKLGCKRLAVHSNELLPEPHPYAADLFLQYSDAEKTAAMIRTLTAIAPEAEAAGVTLCLEALNVQVEHIGNFLKYTKDAAEIVSAVNSPAIKILYDAYHMYLNEGKIMETLRSYLPLIGCIHIADAPGRGEPGTGAIDYRAVLQELQTLGYDGIIAFELFPKTDSAAAVAAINAVRAGF
ncbi:MAG: AP endonuclease [Ruminococcaceae bacterium]|nr:AP endonuclease [Oscillospiraceae bacterium]